MYLRGSPRSPAAYPGSPADGPDLPPRQSPLYLRPYHIRGMAIAARSLHPRGILGTLGRIFMKLYRAIHTLKRSGSLCLAVTTACCIGCQTITTSIPVTSGSGGSTASTAQLVFAVQPSDASAGAPIAPAIQVEVEDASGNPFPSASSPVTLSLAAGSGLAGTLSASPVNGIATFNAVSIANAGTYTLVAASPSTSTAQSQAFTIGNPGPASSELAVPADAVVDSAGINVHLGFLDTPYADFAKVQSGLQALGVRHIRDGMQPLSNTWQGYFDEHNELGQLGIKSIFIIDVGQTAALFQSYPQMMSQCFEGYEGPNEYDSRGIANWVAPLTAETSLLSQTARDSSVSPRYTVYGPSLVNADSFAKLGNVSQSFDYGNMHNYLGGRNPGTTGWGAPDAEGHDYGSMAWQLDLQQIDAPGLPYVSTETGYNNDLSQQDSVPEAVSAVYLPRLLLQEWLYGIKRTYLYELISEEGQDYGLFRGDWSAKPGFYALANLLNLLADPGPAFQPSSLHYAITGGDTNLHHLLMQKRDGSFYLALWLEESSYDPNSANPTIVTPEAVTLQVPSGYQVTSILWDSTGAVTRDAVPSGTPIALTVSDKLVVLRLLP